MRNLAAEVRFRRPNATAAEVAASEGFAEDLAEDAEDAVARGVAEVVVDQLEVVEVDHQNGVAISEPTQCSFDHPTVWKDGEDVGRGSGAIVYRAFDTVREHEVALKQLVIEPDGRPPSSLPMTVSVVFAQPRRPSGVLRAPSCAALLMLPTQTSSSAGSLRRAFSSARSIPGAFLRQSPSPT